MRRLLFVALWVLLCATASFGQNTTALAPQALPGLNVQVRGGTILLANSSIGISNTTVALSNNTTNYVFLSSAGVVQTNTTGFTSTVLPIATVLTAQGQIVDIQDNRPDYIFAGSGLPAGPTLPATCTPGVSAPFELSVAPYTINYCSAANTWTAMGNGGTITAEPQYSIPIYSSSGSSTTLGQLCSPPTTNGTYGLLYSVTASAAVSASCPQVGLTSRAITGSATTDTVLYSDVTGQIIDHDLAATGAVNETLPTPTTLGNSNAVFLYQNHSKQVDTITPTTWTIQSNTTAAAATLSVYPAQSCRVSVDPFNSTNWIADCGLSTDKNGLVNFEGNSSVTSSPPTSGGTGNVPGWKYCLGEHTNQSCTAVVTQEEYHLVDQGGNAWFGIGTTAMNNNAVGTSPDTASGTALSNGGVAGALYGKEGNCSAFSGISSGSYLCADSTAHEWLGTTNGSSSFGLMVRRQPGAVHSTGNTIAITTATLCAASAGACNVAGDYEVHWAFTQTTPCTTVNAGSGLTFLLTWTDSNAQAHSAISMPMFEQGTATTSVTFHTGATGSNGTVGASGTYNISSNGSIIQYATGLTACATGGPAAYTLDAWVTRAE